MIETIKSIDNVQTEQPDLPLGAPALLARLQGMDIPFQLYKHAPIFTVEEGAHLKAEIPGIHCRNLFVRDKKKRMFLVVAANETKIDLKKLADVLESGRLSFGSKDRLWQYLKVKPGSVCPFAIANDTDGQVKIILDAAMMKADTVCYHPMENQLTIGLKPDDLIKFVENSDHTPHIVDLTQAAPDE